MESFDIKGLYTSNFLTDESNCGYSYHIFSKNVNKNIGFLRVWTNVSEGLTPPYTCVVFKYWADRENINSIKIKYNDEFSLNQAFQIIANRIFIHETDLVEMEKFLFKRESKEYNNLEDKFREWEKEHFKEQESKDTFLNENSDMIRNEVKDESTIESTNKLQNDHENVPKLENKSNIHNLDNFFDHHQMKRINYYNNPNNNNNDSLILDQILSIFQEKIDESKEEVENGKVVNIFKNSVLPERYLKIYNGPFLKEKLEEMIIKSNFEVIFKSPYCIMIHIPIKNYLEIVKDKANEYIKSNVLSIEKGLFLNIYKHIFDGSITDMSFVDGVPELLTNEIDSLIEEDSNIKISYNLDHRKIILHSKYMQLKHL